MYNILYEDKAMLTIVIQNNVYFPTHNFTVPVDPHQSEHIGHEREIALFFGQPVKAGDIGLKCAVHSFSGSELGLEGQCRIQALQTSDGTSDHLHVNELPDIYEKNLINEGLIQGVRALVRLMFPDIAHQARAKSPGTFADMVASNLDLTYPEKLRYLNTPDSISRVKLIFTYINRLNPRSSKQVLAKVNNPFAEDIRDLEERIEETPLSDEARSALVKELSRLKFMHQYSPEYSVSRNFVEFVLDMPWEVYSHDHLDIEQAKEVLDGDHYNLVEVKERILEFLAVKKLNPEAKGSILCFCGPPGVGKTSLGKSIATAMGRAYIRMSLGGIRDEAEIRGHRRTYIGAMPGRIIKELQRAKTMNPVFILDEIDKIGKDFRGDPSSALLEVLDPEQNLAFKDNYLEVAFDLSHVMFIGTANTIEGIPPTLLDRMEVINISGYTDEEKLSIARQYLVPKKARSVGLDPEHPPFTEAALALLIDQYTMESGVRDLERRIESLYRKLARKKASAQELPGDISDPVVQELLGPAPRHKQKALGEDSIGMATGLAWTPAGGEILIIETLSMPGSGRLELTGNMGNIMQESARIALGYLKGHGMEHTIDLSESSKIDIHIHVPAGAISKDGPSAGLAMLAALLSHFQHRPLRHDTAITGEITLSGRVLPVGGIKEKILAARRAGIPRVIIPSDNEPDVLKLVNDTSITTQVLFVCTVDDIPPLIFSDWQDALSPRVI